MPILCGTDFSEGAADAHRAAASLARRLSESVVLAHAADLPAAKTPPDPVRESLLERARVLLRDRANDIRQSGLAVEEELLTGIPDEALLACADRVNARILVLSSLGRRSGAAWSLGSTADRVSQSSRRPILVVRGGDALEAWARGERSLRIIVGVDFSETADAAMRWVAELRKAGPCDVVAAHVCFQPAEHQRLGVPAPITLGRIHPDVEKVILRDLEARFGPLAGSGELRFVVRPGLGRTADVLVDLAAQEPADLLVVGTHQRKGIDRLWHGSVSHDVLNLSRLSVAVVPMPAVTASTTPPIPRLRSVLVPTDLSDVGNHAIPYAYSLLASAGTVFLLHVAESLHPASSAATRVHIVPTPDPKVTAQRASDISARLQTLVPPESKVRGIATRLEIVEGTDVTETICQVAERLGVDAICMGSHGRSGVSRLILGSVAQGVMTKSTRPLLVIRPPREG
ncbi:MAG: universal stress protein [Planctomycetes bacterium]|nr:universal stress protein [Planctomycetota bacterium]